MPAIQPGESNSVPRQLIAMHQWRRQKVVPSESKTTDEHPFQKFPQGPFVCCQDCPSKGNVTQSREKAPRRGEANLRKSRVGNATRLGRTGSARKRLMAASCECDYPKYTEETRGVKLASVTTKKSREMISEEWFFKNVFQRCRVVREGFLGMYRCMEYVSPSPPPARADVVQ